MRSIWTIASSFLTQIQFGVHNFSHLHSSLLKEYSYVSSSISSTGAWNCPKDSPVSCQNSSASSDTCCFIYPGGQLLSTQFWDTEPAVGPADSWTLHGLWADYCDGSYPTYCNAAPNYHNISDIISAFSPSLLEFMKLYWLPNRGSTDRFWDHEWNKHGTCMNTLAPSCYDESHYNTGIEVVDYFQRAIDLFKSLNTYEALRLSGIIPNFNANYTAEAIKNALIGVTGNAVVLGCSGSQLDQVWYTFNLRGSLQNGEFISVPPGPNGWAGNCPATGIRYLPKNLC